MEERAAAQRTCARAFSNIRYKVQIGDIRLGSFLALAAAAVAEAALYHLMSSYYN